MKSGRNHPLGEEKNLFSLCREHIICPLFAARDLSGLGCALKEGHDDTGEDPTGGEADAI